MVQFPLITIFGRFKNSLNPLMDDWVIKLTTMEMVLKRIN